MPRFSLYLIASVFCCSVAPTWAQDIPPLTAPAADGSVSDGVVAVRDMHLAWEPFADFPVGSDAFRYQDLPKPPFALTLMAHIDSNLPNRRGPRAGGFPGRVSLLTANGGRLPGTALRDFAGGDGVYKWVWNDVSMPDPRAKTFDVVFDYSTAVRAGIPPEKEGIEWNDIPVGAAPDTETQLGNAKTEKVTPAGIRIWLESVMVRSPKARPNGEAGIASVLIFGRWMPPAGDPAMRVIPELTREMGNATPALTFDNGEAGGRVNLAMGRQVDRADDTPGWFTVSAPLLENAHTARLRVSLLSISPLKTKPDVRSLHVSLPPAPFPGPKTEGLPAPIAQQPLGTGQLQLFAPILSPANGYKWYWRAPLYLQMPKATNDGTQWQDTGVIYQSETIGMTSTGLRTNNFWKLDNSPLQEGEVARQVVFPWSERPNTTPPTKVDIKTQWRHIKQESFSPRYANLPVPTVGKVQTPDLAQPLGEWGSLVLRKIAAFGPTDDLGPRFKKRIEKFFALGGIALVFEHVPAAGKAAEAWDLQTNYPTWDITLDEAQDDQNYPLRRVTDGPDGRHLPAGDDLRAEETFDPKARQLTIYLLPPTPKAKTFSLSLRVRHQANLGTQTVTFAGVELPQQAPQ